jgi:hypothetical protein
MTVHLVVIAALYAAIGAGICYAVVASMLSGTWNVGTTAIVLTHGALGLGLLAIPIGIVRRRRTCLTILFYLAGAAFWIGLVFVYYGVRLGPEFSFADTTISLRGESKPTFLPVGIGFIAFALYQYLVLSREPTRKWFRSYVHAFDVKGAANGAARRVLRAAKWRRRAAGSVLGLHTFVLGWTWANSLMISLIACSLLMTSQPLRWLLVLLVGVPLLVVGLLIILLVPTALLAPVTGLFALSWRKPKRILLLRPFHREGTSLALRRLIRESVGFLGHVYTLSDPGIHQRWYLRWPVLLPQTWLLRFRPPVIRAPEDLARLRKVIEHGGRRSLNWFSSSSKIFAIPCADSSWKEVLGLLLELGDLVLIDLTHAKDNVLWELGEIGRRRMIEKVVCIAEARQDLDAAAAAACGPADAGAPFAVFPYDADGFAEFDRLLGTVAAILSSRKGNVAQTA